MPGPGEYKTVQARILQYAEETGWTYVPCGEAEARKGFDPDRTIPEGGFLGQLVPETPAERGSTEILGQPVPELRVAEERAAQLVAAVPSFAQ